MSLNKIHGFLDTPFDNLVLNQSSIRFVGWGFSESNENIQIEIYVDDILVHTATPNLDRNDVAIDYPKFKNSIKSGYDFKLNLNQFNDGVHIIKVFAKSKTSKKLISTIKAIFDKSMSIEDFSHTIHPAVLEVREKLGKKYLKGNGIEIGALHYPLTINANVKYVDYWNTDELKLRNPTLKKFQLVNVDIIDDGEKLSKIPLDSQDFIIANHFIEHTQNPIKVIETHLSRLKKGGILFYVIPDKWKSFDSERPITDFDHLLQDYNEGPEISYHNHLYEWTKLVQKAPPKKISEVVKNLEETKYSIHFHVWDVDAFKQFLEKTNDMLKTKFQILEFVTNSTEIISILKKI